MSLPVEEILPQLRQALTSEAVVILEAPPGAGKTTRVPLALLDADWLAGNKIILLEPRRIAARSAAAYMANLRGEALGQTIGYQIRHENCVGPTTRIEVVTEAILTRRMQSDPELQGIGLVIFDEFHERNIHSDTALALCNDLRAGLRNDLRLLIMSATLDTQPLAKQLQAQRISSSGRSWPVEISYLGGDIRRDCLVPAQNAIQTALMETAGDILVFLPGVAEIEQLRTELSHHQDLLICPLHSRLNQVEQQLALTRARQRKIILATNIAETSLTIDGVGCVIDTGLCRRMTFNPAGGINHLQTLRISQASSHQRAGRAGRQQAGTCYRLWSENVQARLLPQTPPEIRQCDLTELAFDLCAWGVPEAHGLEWIDPPPAGALAAARQLLIQLELIDAQGRLTPLGKQAQSLPLHPRFARLLLKARQTDQMAEGLILATWLSENLAAPVNNPDLTTEIKIFADKLRRHNQPTGTQKLWQQLQTKSQTKSGTTQPAALQLNEKTLTPLLLAAFPDRIAYSRQANGDYLLYGGRGARLAANSPMAKHPWLLVIKIHQQQNGTAVIDHALPLGPEWLKEMQQKTAWQSETSWDEVQQRVIGYGCKRLGFLELQRQPCPLNSAETGTVLCELIRKQGETLLNWSPQVCQFLGRLQLVHLTLGAPWPEVRRQSLLQKPETWLLPWLDGLNSATQLKKFDLLPALHQLLNGRQLRQLDELAPMRIKVPSGEEMKIDYRNQQPFLAVKLQQLFGLATTPRICRNQVALQLHLLSPAGRPLAVTSDLASFWNQVYPEVRKEMQGRYPKHPWPEDPWNAAPTRRIKSR